MPFIGPLIGIFQSILPDVFRFLKDKQDKKHELLLYELQIQREERLANIERIRAESKIEAALIKASSEETQAIQAAAARPSGVRWIDGLSASVRPTLTYVVFTIWAAAKFARVIVLNDFGGTIPEALTHLWGPEDVELMGYMVAFWFGDRASFKRLQVRRERDF